MKKLILIFFLLCLSNIALPQSGWFIQNSGVGNTITSIHFANSNTGLCTTLGGFIRILKTTNGGGSWFATYQGYNMWLYSVKFTNNSIAFAAGGHYAYFYYGRVWKSIDGGNSWSGNFPTHYSSFNSISFVDSTGWTGSSDGHVFKTTNMGANWINFSSPTASLWQVFFCDLNTGYATGYSLGVLKSTDGGYNWNTLSNLHPEQIFFINKDTGWIVGDGFIHKTTNGGYNWLSQINDNKKRNDIYFIGNDTGYVVGDYGLIEKTTNSGLNWIYQTSPDNVHLHSVYFCSQDTGWAVGDNGRIFKTTTGGVPTNLKPVNSEIPNKFIELGTL